MSATTENVQHSYYGNVLKSSNNLKMSACRPTGAMPPDHQDLLIQIDPEICDKF